MARKRRVPESLRRQVRERAAGRCEYCLIHEDDALFPHEPDHIIAIRHGGKAEESNLAWACGACNRLKGSDIASIDPLTGRAALLFNPRTQKWSRHFRLNGPAIEPLTASGRVTVFLLQMNSRRRVTERLDLIALGRYPGG